MKKNSSSKGHLIDWLLAALNRRLYRGLGWHDRQRKIFFIVWTHKSAEQWSENDLEPFEAWAIHKGKREGKNDKQLKATFRCALNSKKEHLKELRSRRTRSRRFWQFIDPESAEIGSTIKRNRKVNNGCVTDSSTGTFDEDSYDGDMSSLKICSSSEAEILTSGILPNFETFCSFASLTPPHRSNEISVNFSEAELSQQESSSKENVTSNSNRLDRVTPDIASDAFSKTTSFENFYGEGRRSCTPQHNRNKLTPPLKEFHTTPSSPLNEFDQLNTDVWQPNCWTTSLPPQNFNTFNQFFSDDFEEKYKPKELETNHNRMDAMELDQFVPVMGISQNVQIANRNGQYSYTSKTSFGITLQEQMKLDDDYLLSYDVNQEECDRIFQELNRLTPPSETGLYSYCS